MTRSWFVPLLALLAALTPTLAFCGVGVAMVPYMKGVKDDTADWMYELAGSLPTVDRIYVPVDAADLLDKLPKIARIRGPISNLVIMGHGDAANPSIQFSKGSVLPHDVDLARLKGELKDYQQIAAKRRAEHQDATVAEGQVKDLSARVQVLESVSLAMAPNANVLLINCSAAATPKGVEFVKNLGDVLLRKRGGTIVASKSNVRLKVVRNTVGQVLHRIIAGEWANPGDMLVQGDWVWFRIDAH